MGRLFTVCETIAEVKMRIENALNQSQGGIYINTGLARAANAVIPANAGIQESFCSFRLRKLTHRRSPKQTLGFG